MKILLCSITFQRITHGPAKFAQFLLRINDLFPEHEVRILTEGIEESIEGKVYKTTLHYPRPVYAFGKFIRMWYYYREALKLREEYPFDVLVFNNVIIGLLSGLWMPRGVKVVGMLNDDDYLSTGLLSFYWSRKWVVKMFHKPFEAMAARSMSRTITCSEYLRRKAINIYRCNPSKVVTSYKGVEAEDIEIRKRQTETGQQVKVLYVKSDYRRGGLSYLIKALSLLSNFSFELIIIGPLLTWREQIEKLYLPAENIQYTFLGAQSQAAVFRRMQSSDILCIPSLREGLGVANIEGLTYGIPVVSTNVGGIPEVLGNGDYGWLAEPANPDSLAQAIRDCIENPEIRWKKSKAGRRFVEEKFGYQEMLKRFIQILEEA